MSYSMDGRIFILEHYFETKLDKSMRDVFKRAFPGNQLPANSTISRLVAKIRATGSCANLPKLRNPTVVTPKNRACLEASVAVNPRLLIRKHAPTLHLQHMLHDLHLKPYWLELVQELRLLDYARCLTFSCWLLHLVDSGNRIAVFDNFFFSDEACFHLDGFVDTQN